MFRDGLSLSDIDIQSVSRNGGNDRYSGVVVVELRDSNQKREIFKKKKDLKKAEITAKFTLTMVCPLKQEYFKGTLGPCSSKSEKTRNSCLLVTNLCKRNSRTYCGLECGTVEDGRSRRMTTHSLEN
jgi:hypothetical protein